MLNTGGELTLAREMTLGVWGPLLLITGRELTLAREMTLTYKGILVWPAEICHLGGYKICRLWRVISIWYLWKGNLVIREY